jgi:ribosomal protein L11 methylase PrmA
VVYDLGCGDGRIVVTAAQKYGATGTGFDIDPVRIAEANENARKAGVTDKVKFENANLFETDLSKATVITMYLLPTVNMKLRPKIMALKPGTRIVSHAFDMGDWKPEKTEQINGATIYYWTVPQK